MNDNHSHTGATSLAAPIADQDTLAFSPPPQAKPPRRRWPWLLLACVLGFSLLALVGALGIVDLLGSLPDGIHVSINGERWEPPFTDPDQALAAVLAAAAGLFVLLLVLPMFVLLVLVVAVLAVTLAVGSALLVMLVAALVVLSPLWLLALLLWLLLRGRGGRPAAPLGAG